MANEDIVFKASIDEGGKGAQSLTTLKKEFKDLQAELSKTEVGTKQYLAALQKLGKVKDEIGDLRQTINALNPEGKVQAFTNVAGKLAGGFQAATGAAALFGTKSEELEKTLLKVQAATAFAEGIRSISGLGDAFNVMSTVIKTQVITALSTLRGALIATGIGAAAVALGILISKAIEYNEALDEEYDKQKKLNEELKKTTDEYLKQAAASEELRNRREGGINALQRELKILEAQGAAADVIAKKKQDILDKEIFNLKVRRSTIEGNAVEEAKLTELILDKEAEKQAVILGYEKKKRDEYAETARKRKEAAEKGARDAAAAEAYWNEVTAQNDADIAASQAQAEKDKTIAKAKALEDEAAGEAYWQQVTAENDETIRQSKKQKQKDDADGEIGDWQRRAEIAKQGLSSMQNISDTFFNIRMANLKKGSAEEERVAKKQFQINKSIQISLAVITGLQGILSAATAKSILPEPFRTIQNIANAVGAATLMASTVSKIASTQYQSGSSGGSAPSLQAPQSSAPQIQTSAPQIQPSTRLNEQGQNLSQPQTIRAYVVETDGTAAQNRVKRLENQASFG